MPKYRVKASYDMNFSRGSETYKFPAKNNKEAREKLRKLTGGMLDWHKRGVTFDLDTLARVL